MDTVNLLADFNSVQEHTRTNMMDEKHGTLIGTSIQKRFMRNTKTRTSSAALICITLIQLSECELTSVEQETDAS